MLSCILYLATAATAALALTDSLSLGKRQTLSSSKCTTNGVHMIVARASTEDPGLGNLLAPVVLGVQQFLPGSDAVGVDYPATLIDYGNSIGIGTSNTSKLIEEYVTSCPNSKIVLLGYSQGAQVIGDTVCGTTSEGFEATSALASQYRNNIIAVVGMGDPGHVAGIPTIDYGSSTNNGIFPRTSDSGCLEYMNITRSYCDSGDAYCDSGLYFAPHYEYVAKYGVNAVEFICANAAAASVGHVQSVTSVSAIASVSSSFTGFPKSTGYASSTGSAASSPSTTTTSSTGSAVSPASTKSAGSVFLHSQILAAISCLVITTALFV